jgi:hypothetical protein
MALIFLLSESAAKIPETGFRKHQSTHLRQEAFDVGMDKSPFKTDER